jgi:MoaA/NifB/PqqE/SkfB family radical SAM enzyme
MQTPTLKLKEIIWEITSECHNNCSYCGSKSQCKNYTNPDTIKKIADEIAKYQPEEINISGGDPLLVPIKTHKYIKETLNETKLKILINPKSLKNIQIDNAKYDILELYGAIGISVNTQEELNALTDIYNTVLYRANVNRNKAPFKSPTIITNFNLSNIFMFEQINEFCQKNDNIWQIQFTIYNDTQDSNNTLALYIDNNTLACQYLFDKINDALDNNTKIIIADNMNDGNCSAGINSLGILSDGTIIPCLSMRSWTKDLQPQGNILNSQTHFSEAPNLGVIWQQEFTRQRFCNHECCKEHCNNKIFNRRKSVGQDFIEAIKKLKPIDDNPIPSDDFPDISKKPEPYQPNPNTVMVYGIVDRWNGGFVKPTKPCSTRIYGVSDEWKSSNNDSDGETTKTDGTLDFNQWEIDNGKI